MRSYIIHMRGEQKRQENVRRLLKILPRAQIADAVAGRDALGSTTIAPGTHHLPRYPFPLAPGEVGCFLSHRQCWKSIIAADVEYALIAEDDLSVDPDIWPDVLDLINTHASADTYIRLPVKDREHPASTVAEREKAKLFLPRVIGLQTVCQVVGRHAAARLLAASDVLDRPVDTFVQMHWATGQVVHTIHPNGLRELTGELGGSTIQKNTRTTNWATREINRVIYRARIGARPQNI
ncbi:MAG: glycosyltransferase family 25 protein [Rhodobacteraceae bacterium]|nr:glycosyltransferase family 25 protein [Paracoccaceae bacterium]